MDIYSNKKNTDDEIEISVEFDVLTNNITISQLIPEELDNDD